MAGNAFRNEDICGANNGRRLYLELGEKGILYARNVRNSPRQLIPRVYASTINSSHYQCSLELVTCPSCVIIVIFKSIALPHHCGDGGVMMDSPCRCDYVWLSEPPYEDVSGSPFCGSYAPITYRSSTRTLSINLLYSQSHKHAFTIEYAAERNRLQLKGTEMTSGTPTKGLNGTGGGILTSPFFPARYPRDLGLEYVITCPSEAPSCRIRLLFSDFQLATVSIMEFYDWNGQRFDVSSGARFRPPVIVSSGASLLIRFYANGGTGLGYKAFYSFVIGHTYDKSVQPITDCGGYVENLGGAITMMNMVGQGVKTYDCVWLIRPPKNFLHMKTHMYLKVVGFTDMAGNTELIIKQGPTSALMSLEIIRHPARQLQPLRHREHVAPVTSGFHVSLRGTFGRNSHLAIAYAAFSYTDCFTGTDFLCQNHRCIPSQLNCDGFDHCGDNSDEPATCFQDWEAKPRDRKWRMNKANYYFPKIDRYPDLKTATLVFVASSLGLIILISALIILLYRIGARARQQRELQSRLETISELLDGARIDEISGNMPDDPPGYEAPPGYEEVAKLALPKKARCLNREFCNGNSPSHYIFKLYVFALWQRYDEDVNSSSYLVVESGSSQAISLVSENGRYTQRIRIPESPPPPYITSPASVLRNVNLAGLSASTRQFWLRRSAQCPRSTSTNCPSADGHSSLPTDVNRYLTCASNINSDTNSRFESPKDIEIVREIAQDDITQEDGRHVSEESLRRSQREATDRSGGRDSDCSCEGACSCAISNFILPMGNFSTIATEERTLNHSEPIVTASSSARKTDEYQDLSTSNRAIVRLLGCKLLKPSSHCSFSLSSTVASSPCDTLRRSSRKFSRDSCVNKISTVSTCDSYEKLRDNFEIVSETTGNHECTTTPIDRRRSVINEETRRSNRRHSSCDVDSLYEGIKILDAFLARRNLDVDHGCRQSIAEILFGTPRHNFTRGRAARRKRTHAGMCAYSSEDTLSN
ncbi:uncharacterized protein LOC105279175 [Ooceraea biroi]|uniref:Neuropilin and tolloid-like protein n=1 Tax=Ooceraea biroi TaxID=2015173 RepID=A0A026WHC9_OOCBI|nr:uncharacterized protein LOC105279175 [Ooceraea biroi]EZA55435.1 Neuropilin and tolloid-like protein [Ooceraea biroi]